MSNKSNLAYQEYNFEEFPEELDMRSFDDSANV